MAVKIFRIYLLFLSLAALGDALTTVTLEAIPGPLSTIIIDGGPTLSVPLPATETYSPVGVDSDGLTTYAFEEVFIGSVTSEEASEAGDGHISAVITTFVTTETLRATLVEGASEYKYSVEVTGLPVSVVEETDCHWDSSGKGNCEVKQWTGHNSTVFFSTTYSGDTTPVYTLVVSGAIPEQTSISGASSSTISSINSARRSAVDQQVATAVSLSLIVSTISALLIIYGVI